MIDVNGVLTYWGPVTINNEKYYMFIVDNEDSYTAGEITKLAEIIELAMGMWKYTPERDAKAEFIKALMRGNKSLAYTLKDEARISGDDILSVFFSKGISTEVESQAVARGRIPHPTARERAEFMNANRIVTGLNSDIGLRRASNQDNALAGHGIFVVCDGMGGGMGGERASEAVVRHCAQLGTKAARNGDDIEETLNAAQREVLALGESLGGIAGTTISGVIMPADIDSMTAHAADANSTADGNDSCYIVNIGDSRTYHMCATEDGGWDASTFTRITRDHSERQNAIDSGEMLPEEALRNIPRNIITQCIGAPNGIAPDYYAADAFGRFIICSDGLHAEVDKERFAAIAAADNDPQTTADALVKAALRAGGNDNVTVVVVDMITPSPIGRKWTVSKLAEHEDIGDLQDGTLQTLRTIDVRRS